MLLTRCGRSIDCRSCLDAEPAARALLESAKEKIGMIPNMYAGMANFPALLDTYIHGYDLFRATSGFSAVEQEVVFLAISYENQCDYCMAAHSFVADHMSKVPSEVTDALREGREIDDQRFEALSRMVKAMVAKRGFVDAADVQPFLDAGYSENHVLALVLAVGVKTLSNYSNHILKTPLDGMFAERVWTAPNACVGRGKLP